MASENGDVLLLVTHLEDDGCTFSAQIQTTTCNSDLEDIGIRLQEHSKSGGNRINDYSPGLKGKVFAAQYLDDTWYRCRFLFKTGNNKCLVQYIDYGNCEEKLVTNLMDIPLDATESILPAVANRFCLHGIKVKKGDADKTVSYLESVFSGAYIKAHFMTKTAKNSSGCHDATEVVLFNKEGDSIADKLIDLGYAVRESEVKTKAEVIRSFLSVPAVNAVPQAQLYRNPLLSSPRTLKSSVSVVSDILNDSFSSVNSTSTFKNPLQDISRNGHLSLPDLVNQAECSRCEILKETAEKIRLHIVRLRLQLRETEDEVANLRKSQRHWKKMYDDVKQTHLMDVESEPSNTKMPATSSPLQSAAADIKTGFASGSMLQKPPKNQTFATSTVSTSLKMKRRADEFSSQQGSCDHHNDKNGVATVEEIPKSTKNVRNVAHNLSDMYATQCKIDDSFLSAEAMSGFMKKIIMPALSYFKTMTNTSKAFESCTDFETELTQVVAKIKSHVDADQNCKEADRLGLTTRRHTIVENLKQSLQYAMQLMAQDAGEMEKTVTGHKKGLNDLFTKFGDGDPRKVNDGVLVSDVEAFMKDLKTKADLGALCKMIMDGLHQHLEKFSRFKLRRPQFQEILAGIETYEGHERTIKDLSNENRGIRRRKQAIRVLVTQIKNLDEQTEDTTPSDMEDLEAQICDYRGKLSSERQKIHESFESRWHLMGNLADVAEKFYPELLIEYKQLGISDYIIEEGIVIKDMELDHFDMTENEGHDYMNAVVYSTEYRGSVISIHKCDIRKVSLTKVLKRMSVYSNVDCPHNLVPLGVFVSSETAYVMVTKPPFAAVPINKVEVLSDEAVEIVLQDIGKALSSLHENGLTHGMILKEAILYAADAAVPHAFLSVPNFFTDQDKSLLTLANDIVQYGILAKSLASENCPPKIEAIISTCSKESKTVTMEDVLALLR